jgi:hypothetical protein
MCGFESGLPYLLAAVSLTGCGMKTVMAPDLSPDAKVQAVLEQTAHGGAAGGGTEWALYLSEANGDRRHLSLEGHNCNGISVRWIDAATLRVSYPHTCHITTFDNEWWTDPSHILSQRVELILDRR